MADGRDGRIVNKFTPNHFLLTPEMMKSQNSMRGGKPKLNPNSVIAPSPEGSPGVEQGLNDGLLYLIEGKRQAIDKRYGPGAADWLKKNYNQFDTEQRFLLHDVLFNTKMESGGIYPIRPGSSGGGVRG